MSKVPVMAAVRAANDFRRLHWRAAVGSGIVMVLGSAISSAWQKTDPLISAGGSLVQTLGWIMATGALLRVAFADEHPGDPRFQPGPLGFQWGGPEWRFLALIGAGLLIALLTIGAAAFLGGAISAASGGGLSLQTLSGNGRGIYVLILLGLGVIGLYCLIRLNLVTAAIVSLDRFAIRESWAATRGHVLPILAAFLLIALITVAISLLVVAAAALVIAGVLAVAVATKGDGSPLPVLGAALASGVAGGSVIAAFSLPMSAGLTAYLYRGLRPAQEAPV